MAKGQMRSNREARKPKKDKAIAAPIQTVAAVGKLSGGTVATTGKKK